MAKSKSISVEGLDKLAKKLRKLPDVLEAGAAAAVKETTRFTANEMRRRAPRDTGALQDSIVAETKKARGPRPVGIARATAPHAHLVNDGTSRQKAQPFANEAAEAGRREFPKIAKREIRRVMKEAGK